MWRDTPFTRATGVALPLVLAPLGGGPGTPELAAAVSAAGGLGMLGVGYDAPDTIRTAVRRVRELTDRPFGANLFTPRPFTVDEAAVARARSVLAPFEAELGVQPAPLPERWEQDLDAQLAVLLDERVPVVGFTFGIPEPAVIERVKAAGAAVVGTVTTVADGLAWQRAGADMLCAQGAEAGGHRGGLEPDDPVALVGTLALVPSLVDAVDLPVIASGGVMDGRGLLAVLALGAAAGQLGTAFLRSPEAGTNEAYRAALRDAAESDTVLTRAFSGRTARGVRNAYADAVPADAPLPDYPVLNGLTRPLRRAGSAAGKADVLSLWAGQGVRLGTDLPAGELVARIAAQADEVATRLTH